jgi:hypothetical protein
MHPADSHIGWLVHREVESAFGEALSSPPFDDARAP